MSNSDKTVEIQPLEIWEKVCNSNKDDLKAVGYGQRKYTCIDPQKQTKTATKLFGPIGIGWGIKDESRYFNDSYIFYSAILWYRYKGVIGEVAICSECQIKTDCMKIAQTDALTKGLSRIGFNSDVFEGEWDGIKYIGEPKKQASPTKKEKPQIKNVYESKKAENSICYDNVELVKFGVSSIKNKKTYKQCTNQELKDSLDFFGPIDENTSNEMAKHLNTIEAELLVRSSEKKEQTLGYDE